LEDILGGGGMGGGMGGYRGGGMSDDVDIQ